MRLSLIALVVSLTAVTAAPSTLEDRASGPSCLASHVDGNCPYLCQGGSGSLHCEGSKVRSRLYSALYSGGY